MKFYFHVVLQRNTCFLPEDLKNFYLTTDGYKLTWCVKLDSKWDIDVYLLSYYKKNKHFYSAVIIFFNASYLIVYFKSIIFQKLKL